MSEKKLLVHPCEVETILSLRSKILRPGLSLKEAHFEGDDKALHFALFKNDGTSLKDLSPQSVIGCLSFFSNPFKDRPWQLRGMATLDQGRGYGSYLLQSALEQSQIQSFWCNARLDAISFYEKNGLQVQSEIFEIKGVGPHVKMF